MKTMMATGSGIDVEQIVFFIRHNFQNMGVAANVQPGGVVLKDLPDPFVVSPRITSDMGHKNIDFLAFKAQVFRISYSYFFVIDITINGSEGFKSLEPVGQAYISNVAGMPYLIAFFEIGKDLVVQK